MTVKQQLVARFDSEVKTEIQKCPICGSHDTTKMMCSDRYGIDARYRVCGSCDLVYLSNVPNNDFFAWFYSGRYRGILEEKFQRSFSNEALKKEQVKYAKELYEFVAPHMGRIISPLNVGRAIRILDIGGSTGEVAAQLSHLFADHGMALDITVQDPSGPELEEAKKHGFKTVECLFEDFKSELYGTFDFIILCQTIDHVLDPMAVMENALSLLSDDGIFFIDYVDFRFNLEKKGFVESIKLDHVFNFSKKNWNVLLSRFGLSVLDRSVSSDFHLRGYLLYKSKLKPQENDVDYVLDMSKGART